MNSSVFIITFSTAAWVFSNTLLFPGKGFAAVFTDIIKSLMGPCHSTIGLIATHFAEHMFLIWYCKLTAKSVKRFAALGTDERLLY
ncbi:MAG: hypothetical protein WC248_02745 [Candidatus Methanomethylophilaceae archaeon]